MSAYNGLCPHYRHDNTCYVGNVIITAGARSLSVLIIGFVFSVSINVFTTLKQARVREALAIEKAWQ